VDKFFIKCCTILNSTLKEAKRQHCSRLRAKSDNKIESRCGKMKHEAGILHLTEELPSLLIKSEKTEDPKQLQIS
jgi:hypothetical protein